MIWNEISPNEGFFKFRPYRGTCIYFLMVGSSAVMYVGQSRGDLFSRLGKHMKKWESFDGVIVFPVPLEDLDPAELYYQWLYQPPWNKRKPSLKGRYRDVKNWGDFKRIFWTTRREKP